METSALSAVVVAGAITNLELTASLILGGYQSKQVELSPDLGLGSSEFPIKAVVSQVVEYGDKIHAEDIEISSK